MIITIPDNIKKKIELLEAKVGIKKLRSSFEKLHKMYTEGGKQQKIVSTYEDHVCYLSYRFPATFHAVTEVLNRFKDRFSSFSPTSVIDFGAGPGSALLASIQAFRTLSEFFCVEQDADFIQIGKSFLPETVEWMQADMRSFSHSKKYDLVLASYSLGELTDMQKALDILIDAAKGCIVLIEPGTPRGFQTIKNAREYILGKGWNVVAPCPHANSCPVPQNDFCHFTKRLPRSRIHRMIKGGSLGYEDEKFSYVVLSHPTLSCASPYARVLRHPCLRSGHKHFTLCTNAGEFVQKTIAKKDSKIFPLAKKAEWGDILP